VVQPATVEIIKRTETSTDANTTHLHLLPVTFQPTIPAAYHVHAPVPLQQILTNLGKLIAIPSRYAILAYLIRGAYAINQIAQLLKVITISEGTFGRLSDERSPNHRQPITHAVARMIVLIPEVLRERPHHGENEVVDRIVLPCILFSSGNRNAIPSIDEIANLPMSSVQQLFTPLPIPRFLSWLIKRLQQVTHFPHARDAIPHLNALAYTAHEDDWIAMLKVVATGLAYAVHHTAFAIAHQPYSICHAFNRYQSAAPADMTP